MEVFIGIYKLLILDFQKYSQRWNFNSLTKQFAKQSKNETNNLIKWFSLEILSLLFALAPLQKEKFFRIYFSNTEFDDLSFK